MSSSSIPDPEAGSRPEIAAEYVVDAENTAEIARLIKQARLVTERMGLLPDGMVLTERASVLDIGCGPGEWVMALSFQMPQARITGIDISTAMIAYAQQVAQEQHALHTSFLAMDARQPLGLPDASFDCIHLRFLNAFLSTTLWPALLQECRRVLRPGGQIISMEAEGLGISNSLSLTRYNQLMIAGMRRLGQCFSSSTEGTGITAMQAPLFKAAGFRVRGNRAFGIDYSAGTAAHAAVVEDWTVLLKLLSPLLLRFHLIEEEEVAVLYERAMEEMRSPQFAALGTAQRVWAVCPAPVPQAQDALHAAALAPVGTGAREARGEAS